MRYSINQIISKLIIESKLKMNHQRNQNILNKNKSIKKLSLNLFSKFQSLAKEKPANQIQNQDALSRFTQQYRGGSQPIENLLLKANNATKQGQKAIRLAKKTQKYEISSPFLTGAGIYDKYELKQNKYENQMPEGPSHFQILRNLIEEEQHRDDLSQLRKMIKQTGDNIKNCRKKVFKTQKTIVDYTNSVGMTIDADNERKVNSMNRIYRY